MRTSRVVVAAATGLVLVVAAACSSNNDSGSNTPATTPATSAATTAASSAAAGGTIPIVMTAGVSAAGTLAVNAQMSVNAVKAAVEVVNKNGGVDGKQLTVQVMDDKGDATQAVTNLQTALNASTKPAIWFNTGPANVAAATLPLLTQNKILSFNIGPTADSGDATKNPYNFDLSPSPANYATAFCPFAKTEGHTKVAILYADDAYGSSLGPEIKKDCESGGSTVTGIEGYDDKSLDMTPQLQKLQATNPETLILVGYGAPVGYVLQGVTKLAWKVPILGDIAVAATDVITKPAPDGLLGTPEVANLKMQVFQSTVYQEASKQPQALNDMIAALKDQGPINATLVLAYNYDGVQLAAAAMKKAGTSTDSAAVAKAIVGLQKGDAATGVFPQYFFTDTSHSPNQPADAFTFTAPSKVIDGQFNAPGA